MLFAIANSIQNLQVSKIGIGAVAVASLNVHNDRMDKMAARYIGRRSQLRRYCDCCPAKFEPERTGRGFDTSGALWRVRGRNLRAIGPFCGASCRSHAWDRQFVFYGFQLTKILQFVRSVAI